MIRVKNKTKSGSNGSLVQPAMCSKGQIGKKIILVSNEVGQQEEGLRVNASKYGKNKQEGKRTYCTLLYYVFFNYHS